MDCRHRGAAALSAQRQGPTGKGQQRTHVERGPWFCLSARSRSPRVWLKAGLIPSPAHRGAVGNSPRPGALYRVGAHPNDSSRVNPSRTSHSGRAGRAVTGLRGPRLLHLEPTNAIATRKTDTRTGRAAHRANHARPSLSPAARAPRLRPARSADAGLHRGGAARVPACPPGPLKSGSATAPRRGRAGRGRVPRRTCRSFAEACVSHSPASYSNTDRVARRTARIPHHLPSSRPDSSREIERRGYTIRW